MGGHLAVTIRRSSGQEYRMDRWTNPFPYFFHNVKMILEDDAFVSEYINKWVKLLLDYNKHKGDEAFEDENTKYTFPCGLYPEEYGLVVIDYKTKTVLGKNDYTNLLHTYLKLSSVTVHADKHGVKSELEFDGEEVERMSALYLSNRLISCIKTCDFTKLERLRIKWFGKKIIPKHKIKWAMVMEGGKRYFGIDFSPLTIVECKTWQEMYDKIKSLGFVLTPEEEEHWKETIEEETKPNPSSEI